MSSLLKLRLRTASLTGGSGIGNSGASGDVVTSDYFGMHIGRLPSSTIWGDYDHNALVNYVQSPYPNISIGTIRLWDSDGCNWRNIHRSRYTFVWDRLDNAINLATQNNAKIIYTLGCGPDWATTQNGQMAGLYVGYNPHPPSDMQYWIEWCTAVATRYKGKGICYEIWNEVNDQSYGTGQVGSGFYGSVTTLAQLAQLAKQTISAIDTSATFLSPNFVGEEGIISNTQGAVCLDSYLATGAAQYSDYISIHGYNTLAPWQWPEGVISLGNRCKQVLQSHNVSLPLWDTEWGFGRWLDSNGTSYVYPNSMTEQYGSDFVTRMILLNWCAGFRKFCFYGFDASLSYATIKMIDPPSPTILLKPAFAFKFLHDLLVGGNISGYQEMVDSSGHSYYKINITTSDGSYGRVYWTPGYNTATIDTSSSTKVMNNIGDEISKSSSTVLTRSPIFVIL